MEARQAADITENGHQTPEKLIETVKDSSTKMQSVRCGIANKDHQGYFCGFNAVPVLLGKQASEKDKGAFQKSGDAFQYSRLLQTLESHRDIMCQLHHLLATSLTKREGYDAKQG